MSIASPELCAFVRKQAPPHYATPDAPSTWRELRALHMSWYLSDHAAAEVFVHPVFDGGCDQSIYPDAATNHAFRAWHDSIHIANNYNFSRAGEIKVGLIHMQQARAAGLSQRDQDMLIADTIGQAEYYHRHGQFVRNQARFVSAVLGNGLHTILNNGEEY